MLFTYMHVANMVELKNILISNVDCYAIHTLKKIVYSLSFQSFKHRTVFSYVIKVSFIFHYYFFFVLLDYIC